MRDIVLIPTYCRPEYLRVMLKRMATSDGASEKEIWIWHDRHQSDDSQVAAELNLSEKVVESLAPAFANIEFKSVEPTCYPGNSSLVLDMYKNAFNHPDIRYVFLIEDDVLVGKDFFVWHEAVQSRGNFFCTVGWRCIRHRKTLDEVGREGDPNAYFVSKNDYASIGVCWRRENLAELVRHANQDYLANPKKYLQEAFPSSPVPPGQWTEQDGIVTRILHEKGDKRIAWPTLRRCAHVGLSGYHRRDGYRFTGTIDQRTSDLEEVLELLANKELVAEDIDSPCSTKVWNKDSLYCVKEYGYDPKRL
ncbi:MAG: hypothetical protein KDN22_20910 [Verrucomicrobiae bacterium]|nr:hypothetical protein [Verrucomicrobiae bacterium]